jgi:hypothetical protein
VELAVRVALIGIGATALIDAWALVQARMFGVKTLDYALVGRWLGHMPAGRFRHASITATQPVRGERIAGWAAHYLIGIVFAGLLVGVSGVQWVQRPTIGPAVIVGILTVTVPFLVMQPCLGLGIAASRTPKPHVARLRSLLTHVIFGLGLYITAWLLTQVPDQ